MRIGLDLYGSLCRVAADVCPALSAELERFGPIEIMPSRHATVADQLFVEVINQQLSTKAADAIWGRVVAVAQARSIPPRELFVPGNEEVLRGCGISRNKIRALTSIRAAEDEGLLNRSQLAEMPHTDRAKHLCSIWGIGRWTADMIGIFHFLDPNIWPEGDVAAVNRLRFITGRADTTEIATAFEPYRSILARYMWLSRDATA